MSSFIYSFKYVLITCHVFGVQFGAGDTGPQEASAFLGYTVSSVQETVWSVCYMREIK